MSFFKTLAFLLWAVVVFVFMCVGVVTVVGMFNLDNDKQEGVIECECKCDEKPPAGAHLDREETFHLTENFQTLTDEEKTISSGVNNR